MTLLALTGTRVRLGKRTVDLPDVRVGPSARIAILGPNGSGKSTLLRVLTSLVAPESPASVVRAVNIEDVAFLAQRPYLVRGSVLWNVKLPLWVRGVPGREAERRAREELARFGAEGFAERRRDELSGGEAQRAAFARAFVTRPRVLLLDEPLGPLDPAGADLLATALAASVDMAVVAAAPTVAGLPPGFSGEEIVLSPGR